ncbi:hypothetical protein BDZ97DRAFT_1917899 [Flammula alnicola]|nr:hypothetical protein BDZ97DRAFT_1917899 [Flammula alnicola]
MHPQVIITGIGLILHFGAVCALQNITVDDQDPLIAYLPTRPSWGIVTRSPQLDAGGTHMVTTDPHDTAMITYTFINFYFWVTLWPYHITTDISVDGHMPNTLDLEDHSAPQAMGGPATVPSRVVYSYLGTQSVQHTIVISMHPGDNYSIVDMFTFEVLDTPIPIPSPCTLISTLIITSTTAAAGATSGDLTIVMVTSTGTATGANSVSWASSVVASNQSFASGTAAGTNLGMSDHRGHTLTIILAVIGALVGLVLIILCVLWHRRRGQKHEDVIYNPLAL